MGESYLDRWFQDITRRVSSHGLKEEREAWGEYHKIVGPMAHFSRVKIAIGPNDSLKVSDNLEAEKSAWLESNKMCRDYIIFGVLDKMLFTYAWPINSFHLRLLDVEIHEVDSSPIAFRMAARDAAQQILTGGD